MSSSVAVPACSRHRPRTCHRTLVSSFCCGHLHPNGMSLCLTLALLLGCKRPCVLCGTANAERLAWARELSLLTLRSAQCAADRRARRESFYLVYTTRLSAKERSMSRPGRRGGAAGLGVRGIAAGAVQRARRPDDL